MSQRVQRHVVGSVRFDKRRKTWNYLWYEAGKRRSKLLGTKAEYPTKAAAWKAIPVQAKPKTAGETLSNVILRYQAERMPSRISTARVYCSFLDNHILPKWGEVLIQDLQPRPVEMWLRGLALSPKSKTHVRSLLHSLVEFAMWSGTLDIARNPISLVQNKGAMQKTRKARSLTVEQFHALLSELHEPFATMALLCVCLGLRISEALALQWADVDWLGSRVSIRRDARACGSHALPSGSATHAAADTRTAAWTVPTPPTACATAHPSAGSGSDSSIPLSSPTRTHAAG